MHTCNTKMDSIALKLPFFFLPETVLRSDLIRLKHGEINKVYIKEARNSFSFFQTNKHILSLDTVRVIISRQNLARVCE